MKEFEGCPARWSAFFRDGMTVEVLTGEVGRIERRGGLGAAPWVATWIGVWFEAIPIAMSTAVSENAAQSAGF